MSRKLFLLLVVIFLSNCSFSQGHKFYNEKIDSVWTKVADGFDFPEGPARSSSGDIYVSNCYGKWITKLTPESAEVFLSASEKPFTFAQTNGLAFNDEGFLFACDYSLGAIIKINLNGNSEIYSSGYQGVKFNRPNDLTFDKKGNLFFTDPKNYHKDSLTGRVFMVEKNSGQTKLVYDGLAFPNGITFSNSGEYLFVCESAKQRILKFKVEAGGKLSNPKVFVELPGGDPDGIDFDSEGNLYTAHFGGGAVYKISATGEVLQKISTPGKKPSNVEFGGDDLKTLFITECETNSVYSMRVDIPGAKK